MIRILLADDENLIRGAVATMLSLEDDLDVVAQAASGTEAVAAALRLRPDVVILDLQMPELDGIEVAERLSADLPECRVIIVTSHGRPGYLKRSLEVGVRAFLPKTSSARTLAAVIRDVRDGLRYIDPELATQAVAAGECPLSPREADVLELAAGGAPVDEIALRAHLAAGTVRNYLSSAVAKLGAVNRHEAVHVARRHRWI